MGGHAGSDQAGYDQGGYDQSGYDQSGYDQSGYDPGNFYVWRVSDGFAIHLSLNVVTQLAAEISRGGNESPGPETCGILLGRTMDTPFRATVIEDFRLIPSSAASALPDSDDALFEIACRMVETGNERRVLGFFRAQRDGNLNLGARDLQTLSRLFCETGNIALLIQPPRRGGESEASLFYWQHGGAYPRDFGFGFPLDAGQLASGHPGWRFPNPLQQTQAAATPPTPKVQKEERAFAPAPLATGNGIRWLRLLPTAALVAICIVALQLVTNSNHTTAAAPATAESAGSEIHANAAPGLAETNNQSGLGLTVTSRQHQLEIRWNRDSQAIAACDKAVMRITDDGITEAVPFEQSQLRDGYVAYTPKTTDVSIRLEVTGKNGGTTSESIRSVAIP
jgi:hypothetical protein